MSFTPQLADKVNPKQLVKYAADDQFWMEQKLDGTRLAIEIIDGNVVGWGRDGQAASVPHSLHTVFSALNGRWVFDGELVSGTFHCFDLIVESGPVQLGDNSAYCDRRNALDSIAPALTGKSAEFKLLRSARTYDEKSDLVKRCIAHHAEGVMIKDKEAPYWQGRRSPKVLKAKFVETVDCIVEEVGREGKNSIAVELFDEHGKRVPIGSCTIQPRMLNILKVDDVVELKYLYFTGKKIYQPSFLKVRTDKPMEQCTMDQLKLTNKEVLP